MFESQSSKCDSILRVSENDGMLLGMTYCGCEVLCPSDGVFTLSLLGADGGRRQLETSDFRSEPVPAYSFVFHEYTTNFFGNQCNVGDEISGEAYPDNYQFRLAEAFVGGCVLTVNLRDTGEMDWGAASDWEQPAPPQASLLTLVRNLNAVRKSHRHFLLHGRMEKPYCRIECGTYHVKAYGVERAYASIRQSSWTSQDGRKGQVLANYSEVPEIVTVTPLGGCGVVRGEGVMGGSFQLEVPGLSAVVLDIVE